MKNKREIGITLVALIVTIIILLILAGIAIGQLANSGLLENAKLAKEIYENAVREENEILSDMGELKSTRDDSSEIAALRQEIENLKKQVGGVPAGTVISYMADTVPTGYLECNGQEVSRTTYSTLFSIIGTTYGEGDGSTTFKVPDLRGEFLRGTGTNLHDDQGNGATVGTHQDATKHWQIWTSTTASGDSGISIPADLTPGTDNYYSTVSLGCNVDKVILGRIGTINKSSLGNNNYGNIKNTYSSAASSTVPGSYTSRPTNTSVLYCIKF